MRSDKMVRPAKLAQIFCWEFIQNLPLVTGFIGGTRLWDRNPWAAIGCIITGGITGALLIAFTEHRIVEGHREPTRTVIINILAFSALSFVLVAYVHAGWSSWKTDLLIGGCAGFALDRAQSRSRLSLDRHTLAMVGAGGCGLVMIRLLAGVSTWVGNVLILTSVTTLIIVIFDYLRVSEKR